MSDNGRFRVILYKYDLAQEYLKHLKLSKRQQEAIMYIEKNGSISNIEYQTIAKVSKRTATRELQTLKEKGVLEIQGSTGRGTIYKLKGP